MSEFLRDICRRLCDIIAQMAKTLLAPDHYKHAKCAKILAHFGGILTKIREVNRKFRPSLHFLLHFRLQYFRQFCARIFDEKKGRGPGIFDEKKGRGPAYITAIYNLIMTGS